MWVAAKVAAVERLLYIMLSLSKLEQEQGPYSCGHCSCVRRDRACTSNGGATPAPAAAVTVSTKTVVVGHGDGLSEISYGVEAPGVGRRSSLQP